MCYNNGICWWLIRKEEAVSDTSSLFQLLAQTADGAFIIDDEQRIVFWNQAAQDILGYTADDVLGQPCYQILGGCDDRGHSVCCCDCYVTTRTRAGEAVTNYDIATRTKFGLHRWINISILTFPADGETDASLVVHLFRDATRHKQRDQFIMQMLQEAERLQAATLPSLLSESSPVPLSQLTDREREVLILLAQGVSTAKIAKKLSISPATVRNHIQNILNKLHVHSRIEAVAFAFEHGLLSRD